MFTEYIPTNSSASSLPIVPEQDTKTIDAKRKQRVLKSFVLLAYRIDKYAEVQLLFHDTSPFDFALMLLISTYTTLFFFTNLSL